MKPCAQRRSAKLIAFFGSDGRWRGALHPSTRLPPTAPTVAENASFVVCLVKPPWAPIATPAGRRKHEKCAPQDQLGNRLPADARLAVRGSSEIRRAPRVQPAPSPRARAQFVCAHPRRQMAGPRFAGAACYRVPNRARGIGASPALSPTISDVTAMRWILRNVCPRVSHPPERRAWAETGATLSCAIAEFPTAAEIGEPLMALGRPHRAC